MTLRLQYYQPQDCTGGPERKHSGSPLRLTLPVRSALHTCRMLGYDSVCAGPAGMRVRRWHRDECGVAGRGLGGVGQEAAGQVTAAVTSLMGPHGQPGTRCLTCAR